MMTIFLSVIGALVASLICAEAKAWMPPLVRLLLKMAVSRVSGELRERLHEEWSAYLDEVPGHVGKLLAAMGFLVAASKMRFGRKLRNTKVYALLLVMRYKLIFKLAYAEAIVGSFRTRVPRAMRAADFASKTSDLFLAVARFVGNGSIPAQFGKNVILGAVEVIRSKSSDGPPVCWGLNTVTGEVLRVPGGEPGQVLLISPDQDDRELS